jgi:hypothetical protein
MISAILLALMAVITDISSSFLSQWLNDMVEEKGLEMLPDGIIHNVLRFLTLASLTSLAIFSASKGGRLGKIGLSAIPLLLIIDLMGAMPYSTIFYQKKYLDEVPEKVAELKDRKDFFRVYSHNSIWDHKFKDMDNVFAEGTTLFMPNATMRHHLFNSQGYKVLTLSRISQLIVSIHLSKGPDRSRLADLLNIRYIIWPTEISSPDYRLIESTDSLYYYENGGALERAFLAENYQVCDSGFEFQVIMERPDFNPRNLVLLDESPSLPTDWRQPVYIGGEKGDRVDILRYEPERVVIQVKSSKPQFLVLSDAYYPGWEATVNNRKTKVYRADYALRAVAVGPGESIVEFRYRPDSVLIGAGISVGSILIFLGILAAGFVYRLSSNSLLSSVDHLPELLRIKARSANQ